MKGASRPRTRPGTILLGKAASAPARGAAEGPAPAAHWRRWRHLGTALSAVLHALVLAGFMIGLPRAKVAEREPERTVPVEIVKPETVPEPEKEKEKPRDAEKPPEKKEEKQKAEAAEPPKTEPPAAPPETPRAAPTPPEKPLAEPRRSPSPGSETPKTGPRTVIPADPRTPPAAPEKPLAEPQSPPAPPLRAPAPPRAPPEFAELEPRAPPPPRPAPPAPKPGPSGGQVVAADDDTAPPDPKKVVGYWVLDPLTVDLRSRCGLARITATMVLTEQVAEGRYRGTLRNRIVWAACEPSGALYHVELRIKGSVAEMIGAEGFTDRGVIRGNVMMLEDAYGRSVWRKR